MSKKTQTFGNKARALLPHRCVLAGMAMGLSLGFAVAMLVVVSSVHALLFLMFLGMLLVFL